MSDGDAIDFGGGDAGGGYSDPPSNESNSDSGDENNIQEPVEEESQEEREARQRKIGRCIGVTLILSAYLVIVAPLLITIFFKESRAIINEYSQNTSLWHQFLLGIGFSLVYMVLLVAGIVIYGRNKEYIPPTYEDYGD